MNSSKSLPKRDDKNSFKVVAPFQMFYQLTYMSAMAASGISRSKVFQIAAQSDNPAAQYFGAINTLVEEFRLDYADACRRVGIKSKSDNMKSFLLRLSDALRSGEPLSDFLAREAEVQSQEYENRYERDLEGLKQWTNAFSSIVISTALIIIIQLVTAMIYTTDPTSISGMVFAGIMLGCFSVWIIFRSAPRETMTVRAAVGAAEQQKAMRLFKLIAPLTLAMAASLYILQLNPGWVLILCAISVLPIGIISFKSDQKTSKKDAEFSTFLRSAGSMATSTGTTLKQALTRIDLSSFPTLEPDIDRLSKRLQALVEPEVCWHKFGLETGSKLISEVVDIFYGAIKIGGDPERVGYLCSLFTAKTSQLRAKRSMTASTFSALTTVMQAVVAGLMVFVLSIVQSFAAMVKTLMPTAEEMANRPQMSLGMAEFTPEQLQFLTLITLVMIVTQALVNAAAIIFCDGGYKLKVFLYMALTLFISGVSLLVVPVMVSGILKS
jgi:archaeal flagellar protein FlaJ